MELSKSNKKAARELIEVALQRDFEDGLSKIEILLQSWRNGDQNNRDAYQSVYKQVNEYDKYIARRYDNLRGSTYVPTIIGLLMDKVIQVNELSAFSDDVKSYFVNVAKNLD